MKSQATRIVVWGLVAIAVVVVATIRFASYRANTLREEATTLADEGEGRDVYHNNYRVETDRLLNATIPAEPADRAKLEKSVAEVDDVLTKVVADYRAAAAKYAEARKFSWFGTLGKQLDLKAHAYQNRAECEETRRKAILLLVDKSISSDDLRTQRKVAIEQAIKLENESDRLLMEAEKAESEGKGRAK